MTSLPPSLGWGWSEPEEDGEIRNNGWGWSELEEDREIRRWMLVDVPCSGMLISRDIEYVV
jgi:hypothetical protein